MGTRDASESFLKATTARGGKAQRQRRGKQRVLEDGVERRGKARWKEAATVTVEAIAMGMVRRCRSGASALRRRGGCAEQQ